MTEVLVVDDEPSVRLLLRDILEMDGYDVLEAPDGPAALAILARRRPACVVLDVMMPGMTGIEVLARIRDDVSLADLPVMMLTAASDDETTWSGWSAGASYYLPKPFDVDSLLTWIEALVAGPHTTDIDDDLYCVMAPDDVPPAAATPAGADLFRLALDDGAAVGPNTGEWLEESAVPLETEMRRGLRTGQFWVAYQPIIALASGQPVAVEALARWRHPHRGDLAPAQFIPMAQQAGLGEELSTLILLTAARQVVEWNQARDAAGLAPLLLAVNLATEQLAAATLADKVVDMTTSTGLSPGLLVLDVAEASLAALPAHALATVRRVVDAGVRLCLDDFGTASTSLSYLRDFPVAYVKVDRALVRGIAEREEDERAAAHILGTARRFGRVTIAEGVETSEQEQWLRANGCELGQGFHFGHPAPAGHLRLRLTTPDEPPAFSGTGAEPCDTATESVRVDSPDPALPARPIVR